MTPATLHEFLVRGVLGQLRHGLTPDEVRALCGQPTDTSVSPKPRIWKYGSLQVAFCGDKLTRPEYVDFVGLYYRDDTFWLPSMIPRADWWPRVGTTMAEFEKYLRELEIAFVVNPQLTWESQTALMVGIGVSVCFTIDGAERIIDSMQYAARAANQALNPTGNKPAS
jgi:hypothetical protein